MVHVVGDDSLAEVSMLVLAHYVRSVAVDQRGSYGWGWMDWMSVGGVGWIG